MAPEDSTEYLDISTVITRPVVKIDGDKYEITSPEELSIVEGQKVAALGRKLDKLMKSDSAERSTANCLERTLAEMVAIILAPVPEDVRDKLKEPQQLAVIEVFTMLSLARKAKLAGATAVRSLAMDLLKGILPQDGAKSPSGASASTAETRGDG